jgi:hypothetical protein
LGTVTLFALGPDTLTPVTFLGENTFQPSLQALAANRLMHNQPSNESLQIEEALTCMISL